MRSMFSGWNKERFEPGRALACLWIDLSRALASGFCSRGFHGLIPWSSENCFLLRKGSFEVGFKGNAAGQAGGVALGSVGRSGGHLVTGRVARGSQEGW